MGWIFSFIVILMTYLHRAELSPEVIALYVVAAAMFAIAGSIALAFGDMKGDRNEED